MARNERYFVRDILETVVTAMSDVCEPQEDRSGDAMLSVYPGTRPSATDNHTEFLVVSLSRSVYSHGPYQNAAVYIDIFVRNGQGGIERTWRLQELCDKVTAKFPFVKEDEESGIARWTVTRPKLVLDGDDSLGFHVWRIRARLFVNTTDRYATISDI